MDSLKNSTLQTLAYFDIFDCPLTANELRHFLDQKISHEELSEELKNLVNSHKIFLQQGFYTLRLKNIITRQERFSLSRRKLKKALLVSKIFARLPWIKFIALANQIGAHNLRDQGDLDFFIIAKPGNLWLTRFVTAGLMALADQRPTKTKSRDQICLSFFVTRDNLDLQKYLLTNEDLYFTYWLACLQPLHDSADYYTQLITNNLWLSEKLPNWQKQSNLLELQPEKTKTWTCLNIFNNLEQALKNWQLTHLASEIKAAEASGNVIINDQVLKLHVSDRRKEFMQKYYDKLKTLSLVIPGRDLESRVDQ